MKKINWKKGDWCFCEFKLQQITEMNETKITSVSDGNFSHGSSELNDRCFPLDMTVKRISDNVSYWHDQFHKLHHNSLNFPDLNRELIVRWCEMCKNKENADYLKNLDEKLTEFCKSVIQLVSDAKLKTVGGVSIFRQ